MRDQLRALAGILPKRRRRLDDLARELQQHVDLEADEYRALGLSAEDARAAARRALGNPTLVAEDVRAVWNARWAETLWRDIRHGARTLRKNVGFSLVAVLTLALGIGANTAMFTALDALLLRPLPFAHADRLVRLYASRGGVVLPAPGGPSPPDARDYAPASRSFERIVVYDIWRKNVSFTGAAAEPEQMRVGLVPAAHFETLDVQPLMGRLFSDDESHEGRNYVAAISAHLWTTRLASDPAILGRTLRINVVDATITTASPPNNGWTQMLTVARHPITRIDDVPSAQFGVADAHVLRTMGIPLVRGRDFSVSDTAERPAVAIVSAEFVRRYFPNEDPSLTAISAQRLTLTALRYSRRDSFRGVCDTVLTQKRRRFRSTNIDEYDVASRRTFCR